MITGRRQADLDAAARSIGGSIAAFEAMSTASVITEGPQKPFGRVRQRGRWCPGPSGCVTEADFDATNNMSLKGTVSCGATSTNRPSFVR